MRIIKPGVIPEPKIYKFTCSHCGCVFECTEHECEEFNGGDYFSLCMFHKCPTCAQTCASRNY